MGSEFGEAGGSPKVKVETFKGVVQLSSFDKSQADIDKAVQVARVIAGVKSLHLSVREEAG